MDHRDILERFSLEETANILGVSLRTVERWIDTSNGPPRLGYVRVGARRFVTADQIEVFWKTAHRNAEAWTQPELPFDEAAS